MRNERDNLRFPPGLAEKVMFFAIALVPFQQAFTLPLWFPLKMSEALVVASVALFIIESRRPRHALADSWALVMLGILAAVSTVVWLAGGGASVPIITQYLAYALLVLVASWYAGTRLGPEWIGRAFSVAAVLGASYAAVQLILHTAEVPNLLAVVNGKTQVGQAFGVVLPRNGPFLEGNYFGFFAGVALFIAIKRRSRVAATASLFCLIYCQSTAALAATLLALLAVAALRPTGKVISAVAGVSASALTAVAFYPPASIYVSRQLGKLGYGDSEALGASIGYSLTQRTNSVESGFAIGGHFPAFGVGPGMFGYWDDVVAAGPPGPSGIANNAYAHVVAELGWPALVIFALLLLTLAWRVRHGRRSDLALAVFIIAGLNASASWSSLPIWFAVAYLATVSITVTPNSVDAIPAAMPTRAGRVTAPSV